MDTDRTGAGIFFFFPRLSGRQERSASAPSEEQALLAGDRSEAERTSVEETDGSRGAKARERVRNGGQGQGLRLE